jgi:hypothetical protein
MLFLLFLLLFLLLSILEHQRQGKGRRSGEYGVGDLGLNCGWNLSKASQG